ncbi:hypothetical protein FB451DRAFT_1279865 [Mycena latifolia]|nr:hypothetical protein FB451DRAFT_1279865 [Mycena latifolia]
MSFTFEPSADSAWNDSPAMENMQPSSSSSLHQSTLEPEWRAPAAGAHSYVPLQQPYYPLAGWQPPVPSFGGETPQYLVDEMSIPYTNVYPIWQPTYQAFSEPSPSVEDTSPVLSSFGPTSLAGWDNDYDRHTSYLSNGVADAGPEATSTDGGEQGSLVPDWAHTATPPFFNSTPMLNGEFESFADALQSELEEASPPARYAFATGCVAPADLELVPSRPRGTIASPPAPSTTYSLPPSRPAPYTLHNMLPHILAPQYTPYGHFPYVPNVPAGIQYSPSASGSSTPLPDPHRHYRPAAFRDATPTSCLASPDALHLPMPPTAGPSKPYGVAGAEQSHAEATAKRERARERRRQDPLSFQTDHGVRRPEPDHCSSIVLPADVEPLITQAKEQLAAHQTFVCDWAGCGETVDTERMFSHLHTFHGLDTNAQAVQCGWGTTCREVLRGSSVRKHLRSGKHLGFTLRCPRCEHVYARLDALRRHLEGR